VVHWRQTQRNCKTIPSRWTSQREGAALSDNSPCQVSESQVNTVTTTKDSAEEGSSIFRSYA